MKTLRAFYLFICVIGTVIPWAFFGSFFATNGLDVPMFVRGLFANGAAGGFSADVLISIAVFWVWSFHDSRQIGLRQWWLVLPAGSLVGMSLALPLYLYLRTRRGIA
jgi:hypothetical protein